MGGVRFSEIWSVKQLKREKKEKVPKQKKEKVAKPKKEKPPKPKKEKRAKKPKKGKKGAAPELENPEEGVVETGKKGKKKLLLILLPVLVLAVGAAVFFFVIRPRLGGGDSKEPPPPEPVELPLMYTIGETEIHALPVWGESTVYLEEEPAPVIEAPPVEEAPAEAAPADGGEAAAEGEDAAGDQETEPEEPAEPEEPTVVGYRYEGLSSPGTLADVYITLMTQKDVGFSLVDGELIRIKEPEEPSLERGAVRLAKNAPEDGKAMCILLEWTEELCTVTMDLVDGRVKNPPEPVSPAGPMGMSADQMIEYMQSLNPSVLGLEGSSMEGYDLLMQDGSVLIDGNPCVRISAYQTDSRTGTYAIGGNYFLSVDGAHLYRLDVDSNSVAELPLPQ